jgi:hypothetical protein
MLSDAILAEICYEISCRVFHSTMDLGSSFLFGLSLLELHTSDTLRVILSWREAGRMGVVIPPPRNLRHGAAPRGGRARAAPPHLLVQRAVSGRDGDGARRRADGRALLWKVASFPSES